MLYKHLVALSTVVSIALSGNAQVESRAHYSTNPGDAVGHAGSIVIDGDFSDWSESMIIATCGANDMATAFHGSHENCVVDMYALYAAWDDENLYLAWQMCNTGDTWAREGDGPLTDGGRIGDVPLIVALSVNPASTAMSGKLTNGGYIWRDGPSGVEFTSHVDHLFYMSAKPNSGDPAMFKAVDASGNTDYGKGCTRFASAGIKYDQKFGFHPSHLWRQNTYAEWADAETLLSDPSIIENIYDPECYDNLMAGPVEGLKPHDTKYDTFYEMSIPLKAIGITREWLETYGIGCRVVGTRGESGIDCVPFDPSMVDNVFGQYGKDTSTSHEKDDIDNITYDLASIGHLRDGSVVPPLPDPTPDPEPDPDPTPGPDGGKYNVYFVDSDAANPWAAVHVWLWDSANGNANYTGGVWPGSPMTVADIPGFGAGWSYSFDTDDALVAPMVIFNNGNGGTGNQTDNLVFENNGVYNRSGKVGSCSGIDEVEYVGSESVKIYYNLQGIEVKNPVAGQLYIVVDDADISKVLFK